MAENGKIDKELTKRAENSQSLKIAKAVSD
jgi:hypothetical protein